MKFLVFSDLHLHKFSSFGYNPSDKLPRRLRDQVKVIDQIANKAQEYKVDAVLFGGDLTMLIGVIQNEVANIIQYFLKKLNKPFGWVGGNHDSPDKNNPITEHISLNAFSDLIKPLSDEIKQKVKFVAYWDEVDYDKIMGYDIVILHKQPALIDERGHKFGGVDWRRLAATNKLVFFGHFHKTKVLSDNCFVIGSPMPLNFDDTNDRGIWVIDDAGIDSDLCSGHDNCTVINDYAVVFVKLDYPKFITVDSYGGVQPDGNYYRVTGVTERLDIENAIPVMRPKYFEERIKASSLRDVLVEYKDLNSKDDSYMAVVEGTLSSVCTMSTSTVFAGRLCEVSAKNFLSLGEVKVSIKDGFVAVVGGNGSGKTSLWEALLWVFFNETTKGLKGDDVVRDGCKDCEATAILKDGNTEYVVTRSRKRGLSIQRRTYVAGKETFELDDLTSSGGVNSKGMLEDDKQVILESILGFNKDVFMSSCYFSQEKVTMLTSMGDVDRTDMVTRLLGFDVYDSLYDKVSEEIKCKRNEHERKSFEHTNLIQDMNLARIKSENSENNITECNNRVESLNSTISKLMDEMAVLKDRAFKLDGMVIKKTAGTDFSVEIKKLEEDLVACNSEIINFEKSKDTLYKNKDGISVKVTEVSSLVYNVKQNIKALENEISVLLSAKAGVRCDRCGSVVSSDNVSSFVYEKKIKIAEFNETLIKHEKELQSHKLLIANCDNELEVVVNSVRSVNSKVSTIREKLGSLIQEQKKSDIAYAQAQTKLDGEKKNCAREIADKNNSIVSYTKELSDISKRIAVLNSEKTELDVKIQQLKKVMDSLVIDMATLKEQEGKLDFWKEAFSPKGVRALLLDRFCNQFNELVGYYMSSVSNGEFSITVSPVSSTKAGEARNKIGLDIDICGTRRKYAALSGGQKRRVDVALCLAMNKWVSKKYGVECGLLGLVILDEIFSYLDGAGFESMAELLQKEGESRSLYVISHNAELCSYAHSTVKVSIKDGVTSVEEE